MRTLALCLLLAAAPAGAQIAVYTVTTNGAESPVEGLVDVGTTPVGDLLDTRVRLRNPGTVAINVTTLRVQGVAFSLVGNPTLPYLMAPGTNIDFRVRFLPVNTGSYSATLQANDRSVFFRGIAIPAPRLYFDRDGTLEPVATNVSIDFGRVQKNTSLTRRLLLRNEGGASFTTRDIRISGLGLALKLGFALPLAMAAGEAASFEVTATPPRSGILSGTLEIDGRQFKIDVTATDPPVPDMSINLPAEPLVSGRQAKLTVTLASPSPLTTSIPLTLTFTPLGGAPDDPAVLFVSPASRIATLSITEGDSIAKIGTQSDIVFQTGTTAGTLTFKVQAGFKTQEVSATIAAALPALDTVKATRGTGSVEVIATGFDNTRTASQISFVFYDKSGRAINSDPIRAAVADAFSQYFRASQLGGLFSLKASFPVAGDTTQIGAVEVILSSAQGASAPTRAAF
ncbi:MAG: choice-of-anchor D domain-containing protein [Bryobacterales bacterium]|nr:choice-of-anchor D domain-containing protein [Bryobacterales bacterium]